MITSSDIKSVMLSHWRYKKQCPLVALEACAWEIGGTSDVLAVKENGLLIDIEVKLSISDFKADIKKMKHLYFAGSDSNQPTAYFYFAVPNKMADEIATLCTELYPYAGVIGTDGVTHGSNDHTQDVKYYRSAKRLEYTKLTLSEMAGIVKGLSATVCRLAKELQDIKQLGPQEPEGVRDE